MLGWRLSEVVVSPTLIVVKTTPQAVLPPSLVTATFYPATTFCNMYQRMWGWKIQMYQAYRIGRRAKSRPSVISNLDYRPRRYPNTFAALLAGICLHRFTRSAATGSGCPRFTISLESPCVEFSGLWGNEMKIGGGKFIYCMPIALRSAPFAPPSSLGIVVSS